MLSANDNTTLSGLTLKFGLLAVVAIGVQSFPVSAVLTMPLLGFYWLGAIVHLYMVSIAYGVFTGQLPRPAIVIPAAFYGLGLSAGVYSDVMARRYTQDRFVEVKQTIPKDVRYVAFSPFNKLRTSNPLGGELRPENADFLFASLRFPSTFDHSNNYEWLPVAVKDKVLCGEARSHPAYRYGADIHRIGDRCYVAVSIPAPDKFLRIGGPMHSMETQTISPPPLEYPWGRVFLEETNIVLHDNARQVVVGKLRGGW